MCITSILFPPVLLACRYQFHVPGVGQKWHWGFYSCNGFHDPKDEFEMGGIQPLWRDVLHNHTQDPFHLMVGGGDQLYNDDVWNLPALVQVGMALMKSSMP